MQQERLTHLLKRYKQGLLTEEEAEELGELCGAEREAELLEWIQHHMETSDASPDKIPVPELEALSASILSVDKGKTKTGGTMVRRSRVRLLKVLPRVAAAVILLAVGTWTLYYLAKPGGRPKAAERPQFARTKDPVAPGGNKAVLTLANGNKIVLDSSRRGLLATQGNNRVVKVDSGMIAYNADAAGAGRRGPVTFNTLSTPVGGQYQLRLADGTEVWLNAASSITFPTAFTGRAREVEVTGETYFEVAPDRMMPFIVRKGDVEVQVLGTHFNVNAYDNEAAVRVTLLEGEVKVSQAATGRSVVVRRGERAEVHSGGNIELDRNVDTSAAVAWKNGEFRFENTTLTELMRQLERWYNVRVVYTGNVQDYEQRYAFVGEIERSSELPLVLKLLELGGVHFKIKDRDLIVMP